MNNSSNLENVFRRFKITNRAIFGALLIIVLFSLSYRLPLEQQIALLVFFYSAWRLFHELNRRFAILDFIGLITTLQYLLAPVISYQFFSQTNPLAFIWGYYMTLPSADYFAYALPAVVAFLIGIRIRFKYPSSIDHRIYLQRASDFLKLQRNTAMYLLLIGLASTIVVDFIGVEFKAIFALFSQLIYVGFLFSLIQGKVRNVPILLIVSSLVIIQIVRSGMFGGSLQFLIIIFLLYNVYKKMRLSVKLILIPLGFILLFLIQAIKQEYRSKTWNGLRRVSDSGLFSELVIKYSTSPELLFSEDILFNVTSRLNQGSTLGKVLNFVPLREPFANGETVLMAFGSALVPRFLWPDKPKLGGEVMVSRFLGDKSSYKRGTSYNIGQIGEFYVNFGMVGGIAATFVFALLLNWFLAKFMRQAWKTPILILWAPIIFTSWLGVETDFLSVINSLVKAVFFLFVFSLLFKPWFRSYSVLFNRPIDSYRPL